MKGLQTALIRVLVGNQEAEHTALMNRIPPPLVVLGFPRSGTSLVGQLGAAAGFSFGESDESLRPDARNPKGYFEYGPLFRLSRAFLREAGIRGDLDPVPHGLRARGLSNRIRRAFTRRAMMQTLDELAVHAPFGVKLFPRFFYFWKQYLPAQMKVVAIYREPSAVVRSFMAAWPGGGYTADRILSLWAEHNRDMLFQLNEMPGAFLLQYEDLLNPEHRPQILEALARYLEAPREVLEGVIEDTLNRSQATDQTLPMPAAVTDTRAALQARRSYTA